MPSKFIVSISSCFIVGRIPFSRRFNFRDGNKSVSRKGLTEVLCVQKKGRGQEKLSGTVQLFSAKVFILFHLYLYIKWELATDDGNTSKTTALYALTFSLNVMSCHAKNFNLLFSYFFLSSSPLTTTGFYFKWNDSHMTFHLPLFISLFAALVFFEVIIPMQIFMSLDSHLFTLVS